MLGHQPIHPEKGHTHRVPRATASAGEKLIILSHDLTTLQFNKDLLCVSHVLSTMPFAGDNDVKFI